MNITGNTVLVTGGGSGTGRALAESLQAEGNRIIIAGNIESQLVETVESNPAMGWVMLDQSTKEEIPEVVAKLVLKYPDLNVIINNAGVQFREERSEGALHDAEMTVATNLLGPIRLIAALLPSLLKLPQSAIVNISSAMAFVPSATVPTYGATKAALHAYTQALRFQLRNTTVQVIEIVPPWVQTWLQREQGNNPKAMPLKDFIAETMRLLEEAPQSDEKSWSTAPRHGGLQNGQETLTFVLNLTMKGSRTARTACIRNGRREHRLRLQIIRTLPARRRQAILLQA